MERPLYQWRGFYEEASLWRGHIICGEVSMKRPLHLWRGFIEDASLWRSHIKICGEVPPKRPLHSEVVLARPLMLIPLVST